MFSPYLKMVYSKVVIPLLAGYIPRGMTAAPLICLRVGIISHVMMKRRLRMEG
jgi:hypothetical protein